jgi:mannose-6-phosphate isomerase-like protein (cupin superfamily)
MNKIIISVFIILLTLFSGCEEDLEYTDYEITFHKVVGYDDFGSSGAAMVVAIDTVHNATLITALKFNLPLSSKSFIPNCNPIETSMGYNWAQQNTITSAIALEYPYLSDFLTNTSGIRNMSEEITSFLIIHEKNNLDESNTPECTTRFFVAIEGEVKLTRKDDPADLLEGELCFIEMTNPSTDAMIAEGALYYSIDDIYLQWGTTTQPG